MKAYIKQNYVITIIYTRGESMSDNTLTFAEKILLKHKPELIKVFEVDICKVDLDFSKKTESKKGNFILKYI